MKSTLKFATVITIITLAACKKEETPAPVNPSPTGYTSMNDFYAQNGVPLQTYSIDGVLGGSFTTPQGTIVTVPPDAFIDALSQTVTGTVAIQFKDIYKKSDIVLSNMGTITTSGWPLKSGGEFYLKAISENGAVGLAPGKNILVNLPSALTGGIDTSMQSFVYAADSAGWEYYPNSNIYYNVQSYVYSFDYFAPPLDQGTWSNVDSYNFYPSFPKTILTLHPNDLSGFNESNVFLIFKNVNTGMPVYLNGNDFVFQNAPIGVECTMIAIAIKSGNLYASIVPITIASNLQINFSFVETTVEAFKDQLKTLD